MDTAQIRLVSMDEIRARSRGHWFSPGTMRFFSSRVGDYGFSMGDGSKVYFVSSERFVGSNGYTAPRKYTVRVLDTDGDVDTVGEFQAYASRSGAMAKARAMAGEAVSK
jgi:hypothetical protein